jgi:hypothetical protein
MAIPALPPTADQRTITERVNVLVRGFNMATTPVAVASLISAADAGVGARALVTDATVTTFNSVVAGGGANRVPVWSDATNWRIG